MVWHSFSQCKAWIGQTGQTSRFLLFVYFIGGVDIALSGLSMAMLQANSPCYFELIFSSLLATLSLCCTISIHVKPILLGLLVLYGQCCGNVGPLLGLCQIYIWQLGRFYDLSSNRLKSRTKSKHATRPSQNLQCLQLLLIYACAQKKPLGTFGAGGFPWKMWVFIAVPFSRIIHGYLPFFFNGEYCSQPTGRMFRWT